MALADLQAFIVQRLQQADPTLDLSPGSPYDVQVVQPLLRRLGTDPFTVDIGVFVQTLLNQQFPDMATKEGDAITDLLIKAGILLWNPVVREINRVSNGMSFKDPTILTTDEADALGANLFATRNVGQFARGIVRVYFAQPQNISLSPANFVTSRDGLHFFPTEVQSIRTEEMLLNLEGALYYFDVNVVAEAAGDQYNIDPDSVVTIANVASATRITNKTRFRSGVADEDAVTFIGRVEQELTERSLVTSRGVGAKITRDFPEVTRLNVIGYGDTQMQRDVLTGGGLGPLLASGTAGGVLADGESKILSRRFQVADPVDFTAIIGAIGPVTGEYVLTVVNAYPVGSLPLVRDLTVRSVVSPNTLDVHEQVFSYDVTQAVWMLRRKTLTLSGIPGGILYPDTAEGTVAIPDGQVHVGGAVDVFVRGTDFDADTLLLGSVVDDAPLLQGTGLRTESTTTIQLLDFILGTDYSVGDTTYAVLQHAATENLSIQIQDPPIAGAYRILKVEQVNGISPVLTITPALTEVPGTFRWRITDTLLIDLNEPKETKISGSDLRTVQGRDTVETASGVDFDTYGVSVGDVLRISGGDLVEGDYTVRQVASPLFTKVQVDRALPATANGLRYSIFRLNKEGGLTLPFARLDRVELLDTSGQTVGTTIPYARPVDIQSQSFANPASGVKADFTDGLTGAITKLLPAPVALAGKTLKLGWEGQTPFTVTFSGTLSAAGVVKEINDAVYLASAGAVARFAVLLDNDRRVGLLPLGPRVTVYATGSTAMLDLFGYNDRDVTSRDIRSENVAATGGWAALRPALDSVFDVVQILDGLQVGFYGDLVFPNKRTAPGDEAKYDPLRTTHDFNPEFGRHIQVGARSIGTARCYFLDPTSFEVDKGARFTVTSDDGSVLRYFPDPTNSYQRIPAVSGGTKPKDGSTGGGLSTVTGHVVFESRSTDFIQKGIQPGDLLVVDYVPLVGTQVLGDQIDLKIAGSTVATRTLVLSVNGGVDKTIIFAHDVVDVAPTAISRAGLVDRINKTIGQTICSLDTQNRLQFTPDASVIVRGSSAATSANGLLGFSTVNGIDQDNDSPNKGTYTITAVGLDANPAHIEVTPSFPSGTTRIDNQQFKVLRAGLQRIVSTDMAKQTVAPSLYYFDVQLVSEGTGDQYNITSDLQMTATGYRSDGYYLTTEDSNLTFSPVERPKLHLSRSILEVGVSDDPANATQLSGQNIQLSYSRSSLTASVDNYIRSESERVINSSPLARHLIPYFVRFALTYSGGSAENVVFPDLEKFIQELYPTDSLYSSELVRLVMNRGARSVDSPIDLVAVIHNFDRSITIERSQDYLNLGTLAAFIPDVLSVTRRLA